MDDATTRCSRCGGPIEADRAAAYREALDEDSTEPWLCGACATETPSLTHDAIRARRPAPEAAEPPEPVDEDEPVAGEPPSPEEVLDEILRQIKHIVRNQEYEEFSVWNIFGGLVQCFVFFLLFWHYFKGTPDLMWAVVLQLVALTFFVMAKK